MAAGLAGPLTLTLTLKLPVTTIPRLYPSYNPASNPNCKPDAQSESLAGMAAGLAGLRDLDICGCEQLAEDAIMALSSLRALTQLNVGSCQQAVTNRRAVDLTRVRFLFQFRVKHKPRESGVEVGLAGFRAQGT